MELGFGAKVKGRVNQQGSYKTSEAMTSQCRVNFFYHKSECLQILETNKRDLASFFFFGLFYVKKNSPAIIRRQTHK